MSAPKTLRLRRIPLKRFVEYINMLHLVERGTGRGRTQRLLDLPRIGTLCDERDALQAFFTMTWKNVSIDHSDGSNDLTENSRCGGLAVESTRIGHSKLVDEGLAKNIGVRCVFSRIRKSYHILNAYVAISRAHC